MKQWLDFIIKKRYLIALFIFVLSISLELHGSSIANWNNFGVSQLKTGQQSVSPMSYPDLKTGLSQWLSLPDKSDGTLAGIPRMIRSDEWMVQTPNIISQVNTGFQLTNPSYGISGQNMVVAYNAPVWHISVLGKPFNWGFLLLGASRGLSWYWSFKLIGMLLLAFEFSMILTKKNTMLSVLGSFWITFTPAVQWWFMQHLGDVVFYSLGLLVGIYHYFHRENKCQKVALATFIALMMIGFVLVIYPAFQVPFAYFIGIFFLMESFSAWKDKRLRAFDWLVISLSLLVAFAIIGWTLYESRDALLATLNTVYPGSRTSLGGEINLSRWTDLFTNVLLPFKAPSWTNEVEAASAISFLPIVLILYPFVVKIGKWCENLLGLWTICFSLFLTYFALIGLPESVSKAALFSYVTGGRAWQAMGIISVFACLWFIAYLWREEIWWISRKSATILALIVLFLLLLLAVKTPNILDFMGKRALVILYLLLAIFLMAVIYRFKKTSVILLMMLIVTSGMMVNPLVKGLSVIEDKSLSQAIKQLVQEQPNSFWLTEGNPYNYPQMFGAKTLNSVRFYPDLALMTSLDPEKQYEQAWNRYAHIRLELVTGQTEMAVGYAQDILQLSLGLDDLPRLGVGYILTNRDLTTLFGQSFKEIYQDSDGNRIYRYVLETERDSS